MNDEQYHHSSFIVHRSSFVMNQDLPIPSPTLAAPDLPTVQVHRSPVAQAWRRFRRDPGALMGAAVVALLLAMAVFAPLIAAHDPAEQFDDGLTIQGLPVPSTLPASARFVMGTDPSGRDMFSRIVYGARVSLTVGVLANLLAVAIGLLVGTVAGYSHGWPGALLMRFTDVMLAFPTLLLATALVAVLSPNITIIIVVIGVVYWTGLARVIHGQVLRLREQDFVTAAQCLGIPTGRILLRHILPHLVATAIVWGTLGIATNVMLEASLSFLGVGVQPPTPSWGRMIYEGQTYYRTAPWLILFPGIAIMLTVVGFNLLGDGLRDALDPYQQR
jgi:peptide/nickel transport system permease protein